MLFLLDAEPLAISGQPRDPRRIMARQLRLDFAGALHHVTSRGNELRSIFRTDRDRRMFLLFLGQAAKRFRWSISAWVLMTNHYHLVIQTEEATLSRGMQWLNGAYAAWFNKSHRRVGHLFQGRFHSFLIEKQTYFAEVLRYVILNPVRAKMVARPEEYRWSSYLATAGLENAPDWFDLGAALEPFGGGDDSEAGGRYRQYVDQKLGSDDRLWTAVSHAMYLGSESWLRRVRAEVESKPRSTDHPLPQRAVGRPKMASVIDTLARVANVSADSLRSRAGGSLRWLAAWIGWNEGLLTLRSIAAGLRLRSEGHISSLIRRCDHELGRDPVLLNRLDLAIASLRR